MRGRQRALLARAGGGAAGAVRQELAGQWCDALPLLICLLWSSCKALLAAPGLRSTISAVQYWCEVSTAGLMMARVCPMPAGSSREREPSSTAQARKQLACRLCWCLHLCCAPHARPSQGKETTFVAICRCPWQD